MHLPSIGSILPPVAAPAAPSSASTSSGSDFGGILQSAIGGVDSAQNDAAASVNRFLQGEGEDIHSMILTGQRAELQFDLLMQVRNKVVSAYQEVMRMQL